jgi:predicted esterase
MDFQSAALQSGTPNSKPCILCLHGGGTNARIFNIQTIRIQRALSSTFEFIFIDAPFESPPGPGVLPFFEGCGPFYRWIAPGEDTLPDATRRLIDETARLRGGQKRVVGVLGFSQGARLAAGLLLELQLGGKEGEDFKFGVFLMGTAPPLTSNSLGDEEKKVLITTPSVHVVGVYDPYVNESEMLFNEHFDGRTARKLEFQVGHRLPTIEADTKMIVDEILRLYRETGGGRPVDLSQLTD